MSPASCRAENGFVVSGQNKKSYGQLAAAARKATPPAEAEPGRLALVRRKGGHHSVGVAACGGEKTELSVTTAEKSALADMLEKC